MPAAVRFTVIMDDMSALLTGPGYLILKKLNEMTTAHAFDFKDSICVPILRIVASTFAHFKLSSSPMYLPNDTMTISFIRYAPK